MKPLSMVNTDSIIPMLFIYLNEAFGKAGCYCDAGFEGLWKSPPGTVGWITNVNVEVKFYLTKKNLTINNAARI